ncbi:MAG: hypothetical protein ACU84J_10405, partial [Gammaproteobacteria bacterium]
MSPDNATILEKLNPADVFTLAMDDEIRRDGLAGSYGCFALELDGEPDAGVLEQRIVEFVERFPVATASLRQIGRAFYWCRRDAPPTVFFRHPCQEGQNEAEFIRRTIGDIVNRKQAREALAPIEFHLLSGSGRHVFMARWIHPFCDARGAELILSFLCTDDASRRLQFGHPATEPLVYTQLAKYRWWQKIALFWKAKRYIEKLDGPESVLPFAYDRPPQRLDYRVEQFGEHDTRRILELARQQAGLTGTSLYYIGCLMRALERMRPDNNG